ncbi:hypothetical protein NBRC116591_41420 [Sessilibacter corallicola]|uniref:Transposase n=1 Tax=Sessilibacter corallicola TaxID=2904075 RepID=A0ABQ0AFF5_9GAMM
MRVHVKKGGKKTNIRKLEVQRIKKHGYKHNTKQVAEDYSSDAMYRLFFTQDHIAFHSGKTVKIDWPYSFV